MQVILYDVMRIRNEVSERVDKIDKGLIHTMQSP